MELAHIRHTSMLFEDPLQAPVVLVLSTAVGHVFFALSNKLHTCVDGSYFALPATK